DPRRVKDERGRRENGHPCAPRRRSRRPEEEGGLSGAKGKLTSRRRGERSSAVPRRPTRVRRPSPPDPRPPSFAELIGPHRQIHALRPSPSSLPPIQRCCHRMDGDPAGRGGGEALELPRRLDLRRPEEEEEGRRSSRPTDQHRRAPDLPLASSPHGPPGVGVAAQAVRAIVTVRRAASRRRHRSPRRAKGNLTGRAGGGRGGAAAGE
ncbi:Os10g0459900, partial [Oryza sativa Japonica Group]